MPSRRSPRCCFCIPIAPWPPFDAPIEASNRVLEAKESAQLVVATATARQPIFRSVGPKLLEVSASMVARSTSTHH